MSLFEPITSQAREKFGLGDKADSLLAALLEFMTNHDGGGFKGFLDRFSRAGLDGIASSWIMAGKNTPLADEQVESVFSDEEIARIAAQAGIDKPTATSAMAFMIPQAVDQLTPDGFIPEDGNIQSRVGDYLSSGSAGVAAGVLRTGAVDRVGTAAGDSLKTDRETIAGDFDRIDAGEVEVSEKATPLKQSDIDEIDRTNEPEGSILNWLFPLLLLGLLIVLGYWFCGRASTPIAKVGNTNTNIIANQSANVVTNTSAAKTVDSSFSIKAADGKYTVTGIVPDEATRKQIIDALTAQYGAGNVNFDGLKVDAAATAFPSGWWGNFANMLPNLKDWKTGELSFVGNAITAAVGLPQAAIDQVKSLFGTGWKLPVSLAGAETAARQANEEALKELQTAGTVEEVVRALNVSIINFASAKSDIPADAQPILEKAAEVLKKQPEGTMIEIGGHTDSDGNDEANMKLSQARAEAVKKALVALGVKDSMLAAKGYGETAPVAPNDTPDNKFKNRRIEYKTGSGIAPTATTNTKPANAKTAGK